jgi:hypothetical protein
MMKYNIKQQGMMQDNISQHCMILDNISKQNQRRFVKLG